MRIADYNIKLLNKDTIGGHGDRLDKLRSLIAMVDADIYGLQEIADRASLELIFPPAEWSLVIDNESKSGLNQDLAVAVRKPFIVKDIDADLDADDRHFLFPDATQDHAFPNRRDVLCIEVVHPMQALNLHVLVVHMKSRLGGRATTEPRRVEAATLILRALEQRLDGKRFVLMGDWNDSPDGRRTACGSSGSFKTSMSSTCSSASIRRQQKFRTNRTKSMRT